MSFVQLAQLLGFGYDPIVFCGQIKQTNQTEAGRKCDAEESSAHCTMWAAELLLLSTLICSVASTRE